MRHGIAVIVTFAFSHLVVGCGGGYEPGTIPAGDDGASSSSPSSPASGSVETPSNAPKPTANAATIPASSTTPQDPGTTPATCSAPATGATAYVDHVAGTDDPSHGGSAGACAYRTLTYALSVAKGNIALAAGDYPSQGESLPFVLRGRQSLVCDPSSPAHLSFVAWATPTRNGSPLASVVAFEGQANAVSGCVLDGAGNADVVCIDIRSSAATGDTQRVTGTSLTACGAIGVQIQDRITGVVIENSSFASAQLGIAVGRATGALIENNRFAHSSGADISCTDRTPNAVTGSGNFGVDNAPPSCVSCAACPFL